MAAGPPARLTLLGRPDCHLCHLMRDVVLRVLAGRPAVLVERDVREDAELARLYALEIPVLLLGDREVARHRVGEDDLRQRLDALGLAATG